MGDPIGDRMKNQYEDRTRYFLPRRTYTIIRVDGKAFHTLTRGFARPFDKDLMQIMDQTAIALCEEIQGARFAYVQSDEISVLLTDFESPQSCAWFDGNVQKMVSISAAIASTAFNQAMQKAYDILPHSGKFLQMSNDKNVNPVIGVKKAYFDSRVFTIPDRTEVMNYFIWRQNDASRNSVQMAARSVYSHKQLDRKSSGKLLDMLMEKGINWNSYSTGEKRGRMIVKEQYWVRMTNPKDGTEAETLRSKWKALNGLNGHEIPIFTRSPNFLLGHIPEIPKPNFVAEVQ